MLIGCAIILLTGLVVRQLEDVRIGIYFIGGVLGLIAVISVLVGALLFLLAASR